MLYNIKHIPLYRVFHGIRFKVKKIGCRDDNQFFMSHNKLKASDKILSDAFSFRSCLNFIEKYFYVNV